MMKQSVPTPRDTARRMAASLRTVRNPARAEGVQRYFKHTVTSLGIDTPTLRGFVRDQVRRLKPHWDASAALECCDRLLQEREMEIRGAGILVLGAFQKQLTLDMLDQAERWLEQRLDNWALVDGFCGSVLSPMLARYPAMEKTLCGWSRAKTLWVRRASLVTLVPFARKGLLLDTAYSLAEEHFGDDEDLMHKATGWLLREAGKMDPRRLETFLLQHGSAIPRTSVRYAIERFPAPDRARLLQGTRAGSQVLQRARTATPPPQ